MNYIRDGLFAVEDVMPCNPCDIRIGRYALPSTLQRAEREEAAARIISFSQKLNTWVGVSSLRINLMMSSELEQYLRWVNQKELNHEVRLMMRRHHQLCIITLGIYALFVKKPTVQTQEVPKFQIPLSGIFMFGPEHVARGIRELVSNGMLKCVVEGEGDKSYEIFFPTPKIISTIMEKQGVVATQ